MVFRRPVSNGLPRPWKPVRSSPYASMRQAPFAEYTARRARSEEGLNLVEDRLVEEIEERRAEEERILLDTSEEYVECEE